MSNKTRPPGPAVPDDDQTDLVLVQFKGHRKSYYHNRRNLDLAVGQYCLVEADRGRDMGQIKYIGPGKPEWWKLAQKQGVIQIAGTQDLARLHDNRGDEWEFWDICQEKIQARKLKMNLVTVERQFDHKKITFYFTAEKRVDFRELVRDLAGIFRTRIELRQIGVRDEARLKGGLGVCGREFCCSTFLHDFVPVTLKMAKVQQLPLNPGKLSGPCGRLRCCLTYENEIYRRARSHLPRVGTRVLTPEGPGTVRKLDLLQESVSVACTGQEGLSEWPVDRLRWDGDGNLPAPGSSSGRRRRSGHHRRGGNDPGGGGRH
jgi:cell fate regulator YaaT (PSP1 superfamily)